MGFPIEIKNNEYVRNKIVFNCCLVVEREEERGGDCCMGGVGGGIGEIGGCIGEDFEGRDFEDEFGGEESLGLEEGIGQQWGLARMNSLERACEKLAMYLMEFEQKYKLVSSEDQAELLQCILRTVYEKLSNNQACTIRLLEDIICLDLVARTDSGSIERWRDRIKFKTPIITKNIDDTKEDLFVHSNLFWVLLKMISYDQGKSCEQIIQASMTKIKEKLKEKKYGVEVDEKMVRNMHDHAYEILYYLNNNKIIQLTDVLKLRNYYRISFDIFSKSDEELTKEFVTFLKDVISPCKPQVKILKALAEGWQLNLKTFFVKLNNGYNIFESLKDCWKLQSLDNHPRRREVFYFVWLFGVNKNYLFRQYELPVLSHPLSKDLISQGAAYLRDQLGPSGSSGSSGSSANLESALKGVLRGGSASKDEIMGRLKISEEQYYGLIVKMGGTVERYKEF